MVTLSTTSSNRALWATLFRQTVFLVFALALMTGVACDWLFRDTLRDVDSRLQVAARTIQRRLRRGRLQQPKELNATFLNQFGMPEVEIAIWLAGRLHVSSTRKIIPPDGSAIGEQPELSYRHGYREVAVQAVGPRLVVLRVPMRRLTDGPSRLAWLLGGWSLFVVIAAAALRLVFARDPDTALSEGSGIAGEQLAGSDGIPASSSVRLTEDLMHELRTPLAILHSQIRLTLSQPRSATEYRRALEACRRATSRTKSLLDGLQSVSDSQGDSLRLLTNVDLATIVSDCVEITRPLSRQHDVELQTDLQPAIVRCDAGQLAQMATNLIVNAILYNRKGGRVAVAVRNGPELVVCSISDTGMGVEPSEQQRIFERGFQGVAGRQNAEGAGLGLSITREIVERFGGRIQFHSEVGSGSTVTVELPAVNTPMKTERSAAPTADAR